MAFEPCCTTITDAINVILALIETVIADSLATSPYAAVYTNVYDLDPVIVGPPGWFIWTPGGGEMPTLSELISGVTALGYGCAEWSFCEFEPYLLRTEINLPAEVNPDKTVVSLNGVILTETRDYALVDDRLTLVYALQLRDTITVTTYGE